MTNLIIFDLDGTLIYSAEDLKDSVNFALSKFGYPEHSVKEIISFVGNGIEKLIERAIPNGRNNTHFEECLEIFKAHYLKNMFNKTAPYEGIPKLLDDLRSEGYKLAVLSNKFLPAVKGICDLYFKDQIDYVLGANSEIGKKPDPRGVNTIIKHFNANKKDCILVGDSETDIETAKNANINCISVDWGYKSTDFLAKNGATKIVSDTSELFAAIKSY
ncbi:MAG: HAD-IA family hydrolase [Candidatus Gastranaerophilales bacterium]|nr:HAD-IA family hydrolase [Candidatus Gastranaerophilales bacterium]